MSVLFTEKCFIVKIKPANMKEALEDAHWISAMHEELFQFLRNDVWELVPRHEAHNVIGTKWIYKNKSDEHGNVIRNKARLVAHGYSLVEGVEFEETFEPVARLETIILLLCLACLMEFKLFQMDVKSVFLNGITEEEVYMQQPKGFIDVDHPKHVFKLKKALHGLKQAPRAWYERLTMFWIENDYSRGGVDNTLFIKREKTQIMIAQIYVNDIVFGGCQTKCSKAKRTPTATHVKAGKDEGVIPVDTSTYISMIGSLLYLTPSRPDISYSVGVCAKFQANPKESHLNHVNRVIKYVHGITDYGILYTFDTNSAHVGYCDASWAGSAEDRRLYTTNVDEENAEEYSINQGVLTLYCDNLSAINISKNPTHHSRTKHIDIRHHFVRDLVEDKVLALEHVSTYRQIADIFTKALNASQFESLRSSLGLCMMDK
ncbi:transmembrane signal receptor [Lithospermum erythrorhizon]|uniref:Transmembrane signal receptor n=1 Tax=Lithospermum erythrorhizon TaxID=34254 RepID=A0AAV3PQP6_LITER